MLHGVAVQSLLMPGCNCGCLLPDEQARDGKSIRILACVPELEAELEDKATALQALRGSADARPFEEAAKMAVKDANTCLDMLREWYTAQQTWQELEKVCAASDLKRVAPRTFDAFQSYDQVAFLLLCAH